MLANVNTGLLQDEVHYWGNAVAEVGNKVGDTFVDAFDIIGTRDNPHGFLNGLAAIDDQYDFNRDAQVNSFDIIIARDNPANFLRFVRLIEPSITFALTIDSDTDADENELPLKGRPTVFGLRDREPVKRSRWLVFR